MASISVQQLQEGLETIRLSSPKDVPRGMRIYSLSLEGSPLLLKLAGDMQTLTVPFEPSVFNGTGDEPRKGIVFNITPEILEAVAQLEDTCRQLLGETIPNIDALWCSAVKPSEQYSAKLKAKINVSGPRVCPFFDEANNPAEAPVSWKGLPVNAVVSVRGCYSQRQNVGMILDIVALQYGTRLNAPVTPASPF
jgi:hypothetical protein